MKEAARTTYTITFQPAGKRVEVEPGTPLDDAARRAGIDLPSDCGGNGTCGRCRVVIIHGRVTPVSESERELIDRQGLDRGHRLACRIKVTGDLEVYTPEDFSSAQARLQLEGVDRGFQLDPLVQAERVQFTPPSLSDPRSDDRRVMDALERMTGKSGFSATLPVIRRLSLLAREADWRFTVILRDREIVACCQGTESPKGIAVDLGSTKIAAYLMDLTSGATLGSQARINPQIAFGEDILTRLGHAVRNPESASKLAQMAREAIDSMVKSLATANSIDLETIAEVCLVGNPVMTHLLLELPVEQLAKSPFISACSKALDIPAGEIGLHVASGGYAHVFPGIGGYVGGDHAAMILACGFDRETECALGIDIGTNTEIVLCVPGEPNRLISGSCPSGPAFEGAHLKDGMRSTSGAIESVRITSAGVEIQTIDNAPPLGICGSAIVDIAAEFRRNGVINELGRFCSDHPLVHQGDQGLEFLLASGSKTETGRDVVVTQKDIGEFQLAKGAILAGINTLLVAAEVGLEKVEKIIVAGAFGSHLNLENAVIAGMLPDLPLEKYTQVGNAAGTGAKMGLLSTKERHRIQNLAPAVEYLEFATFPGFNRLFAKAINFPNLSR